MELQVKIPENSRYNFFTNKETTNKVPSNIFVGFEVQTMVWFVF